MNLYNVDPNFVSQFNQIVWASTRILLHLHPSPDEDSVGGALAMLHALHQLGKEVICISGDSPLPLEFSLLPGFKQVVPQSFGQVDLTSIDVFIALDSASVEQISQKQTVAFPPHLKTINIDHHPTNTRYAQLNLVNPHYVANCHQLINLFNQLNWVITPNMAVCLYIGLYGDSGGFKYPGTTTELIQAAADMAKLNSQFPSVIFNIENSKSANNLIFEALALSQVSLFFNNQVAISIVQYKDLEAKNLIPGNFDAGLIANKLRTVKGWQFDISLIEFEPNHVKLSFRTRDENVFPVDRLAKVLGGGGHKGAGGARIDTNPQTAIKILLQTLKQEYDL